MNRRSFLKLLGLQTLHGKWIANGRPWPGSGGDDDA